MLKLLISIILLLSTSVAVISQEVTATVSADTNNVLIGEPVNITISVKSTGNYNINFPVFADSVGSLEILDVFPTDTLKNGNELAGLIKKITVTAFEAGDYDLEPLAITYNSQPESDLRVALTNSLFLNFETVEVDTATQDIKDIKPPIQVPLTLEELLPYVGLIAGALVVYYILISIFGKKRKKEIKQAPKYDPRIPADLEALEALQKLERENLWQAGKFKIYHSRLTDILRVYMHRRYHINALEITSGELIEELKKYEAGQSLEYIIKILNVADLAKFAKYEPSAEENISSMNNAVAYINMTKVMDITSEDIAYSEGEK